MYILQLCDRIVLSMTPNFVADKYGLSYLQEWNFESWNEPSSHHFDGLNFTIKGSYKKSIKQTNYQDPYK